MLKYRQAGRRGGQGRKLDEQREARVRRMVKEKCPERLRLDLVLWNRGAVGDGAIRPWKQQGYPAIAKQARAEKAEVHWLDETAIGNIDVRGRSHAKRGRTPVVYAPGSRSKLSMVSTATNKGEACWETIDGNYGIDRSLSFLRALIKGKRGKLRVVMGPPYGGRAHHSKRAKQWVAEHDHRIAVFYLPSHAPELNPDERLNGISSRASEPKPRAATRPCCIEWHMGTWSRSQPIQR